MLDISLDKANFLTFNAPEDSVDFPFDLDQHVNVILRLLEEDANLKEQFRRLIPGCTTETNFWKSYYYNIAHVKRAVLQKFAGKYVDTRKI